MTSKNLSFKLVIDEARRNLWAAALSVLGFLFAIPLATVIYLQQELRTMSLTGLTEEEFLEYMTTGISRVTNTPLARIGLLLMAVLCGIALFRFLHDRRQVDFYHGLPIRRETLYLVKFSAGALLVLPAYFFARLLAIAVIAGMGYGSQIPWGALLGGIGIDLLAFFVLYGIAILITVLCGNTLFAVVLTGWALFSPLFLQMVRVVFATWFYPSYSYQSGQYITLWSPVLGFLEVDSSFQPLFLNLYLPAYVVIGAAALVLSFLLFRRRKSERAGAAVAFVPFRLPLKLYTSIAAGLCFGCVLQSFFSTGGTLLWLLLFTTVSAAVCHCVMESIYHADFRAAVRHPITMLLSAAVSILLVFGLKADIFGYSTWVPKENQIVSVELDNLSMIHNKGYSNIGRYYSFSRSEPMKDPAVVQSMIKLANLGIEHLDLKNVSWSTNEENTAIQERREAIGDYYSVSISYAFSRGRKEGREYIIPVTEESEAVVNSILYSEEYLRCHHAIFSFEDAMSEHPDNSLAVTINDAMYSQNIQTLRDMTQIRTLTEALEADVLAYTPEQAQSERPVLTLCFEMLDSSSQSGSPARSMASYETCIYPSYTRTLALLKEYAGVEPTFRIPPEEIVQLSIFDDRERENSLETSYTTNNQEEIAQLLQNTCSSVESDRLCQTTSNRVRVSGILRNGSSFYLAYPSGMEPEETLTRIFGSPLADDDGSSEVYSKYLY